MSDESEVLIEVAKATQEVAKTTGIGLDTAQKIGSSISKLLGGTIEQSIGIYEDKIRYRRVEKLLSYMKKIEQQISELGLESHQTRHIEMKFGIPLLEAASLEDESRLQDLWVNLTVNSINKESGFSLERAYIAVLEQMTVLEAKILITIYSHNYEQGELHNIETDMLPNRVMPHVYSLEEEVNILNDRKEPAEPNTKIKLALSNLARLQCIKLSNSLGAEVFNVVHPTLFGKKLYIAVSLPKK